MNEDNIVIITEIGPQYIMKDQIVEYEINGVKECYSYSYGKFRKHFECEHLFLELKTESIENLNYLISFPITTVIIDEKVIYVPFEEKQSKNIFQEHYLSKNKLLYILISKIKNLSDICNVDMINDPLYANYIKGGV